MDKSLPCVLGQDFSKQKINSSIWILPKTFTLSGFNIYLRCLFKIQIQMIFNKLSQDRRNWLFGVTVLFISCIAVAPRDPYCAKCRTNTEQSWSLPVGAHSLQFGVNQELLGSQGAASQTHSLTSPSLPTENRSSRKQVSESWTTCPFLLCTSPTDFSQAVVTRPVAELCGLPDDITAAPWRAVVSCSQCPLADRGAWIKGSLFSGLSFILFKKKVFLFAF